MKISVKKQTTALIALYVSKGIEMYQNDTDKLVSSKVKNKYNILRLICTGENITRAYLTETTGLSKMTITNIVNELTHDNYIMEIEKKDLGSSVQGRKPMIIDVSPNAPYVAAIYIGRDYCKLAIYNIKAVMLKLFQIELTGIGTVERLLNKLTAFYDQLVSNLNHRLLGIGISSIGPINKLDGIILNPPNFYGLENIRIKEHFEHHTGLPVCFDNSMNASALAEKLFGYGRKYDNFVYLGILRGVGAGIISNGHLLNGHTGINGEIGHTSINFDGPLCSCGNRGCLELYTSTSTVVENTRALMQKAGLIDGLDFFEWEELASNACKGEQYSLQSLDEFCRYLSIGIVNLVNLFDCDVVFLGHEIALVAGLIEEKLSKLVNERIFSRKVHKVEIKMSYFGVNAPIVGAACNVLYRLFEK